MFEVLNFKIVAVGKASTGKTSLIYKYVKGEFKSEYKVTLGVEFYTKKQKIGSETIQLQIWDTAGQEAYKSIVRTFYRDASAVILVFALDSDDSFNELQYWTKEVKEHIPPKAIIYLVGTKLDLNTNGISKEKIQSFIKNFPRTISYCQTSSKTGQNVQYLFNKVGKDLYNKYVEDQQFRQTVNPKQGRMNAHLQSVPFSSTQKPLRIVPVRANYNQNPCC